MPISTTFSEMKNSISIDKIWLSVKEVTTYLGFGNRATQQEWRDSGQLPFYRIGKQILYKKNDIDDFVEKHKENLIQVQNYGKNTSNCRARQRS